MNCLIKLQRLYVKIKDVINDVILMWYVMWIIGTQDMRERFEAKVYKMDLNIKDREGK